MTRLLSSPALRCVQTLEPTATRLRLPVERHDALGTRADIDGVLQLLESPDTERAALCTHGETLTALSRAWTRTGRVTFDGAGFTGGLAHTPKGACWIIEGYHGSAARAQYVPSHASTGS